MVRYHHGWVVGTTQISVKSTAFNPYFGRKINGCMNEPKVGIKLYKLAS